jgi:hypothetical protein
MIGVNSGEAPGDGRGKARPERLERVSDVWLGTNLVTLEEMQARHVDRCPPNVLATTCGGKLDQT